jgi:muconolactone delta-isomerase
VRFLLKVGLEMICLDDPIRARTAIFDDARKYARQGSMNELWPLFHFSEGKIFDLTKLEHDVHGPLERFTCYSYRLFEAVGLISVGQPYILFQLTV